MKVQDLVNQYVQLRADKDNLLHAMNSTLAQKYTPRELGKNEVSTLLDKCSKLSGNRAIVILLDDYYRVVKELDELKNSEVQILNAVEETESQD